MLSCTHPDSVATIYPEYPVSITREDLQGFMAALHGLQGEELDLILHSPGGLPEVADQIVQYLRSKFKHIRAIVPQNAMSAATMIACACDEIIMGKHSALGPIDPQMTVPAQNGHFTAPACSLLMEFEKIKAEVLSDPRIAPLWVDKLRTYPPGILNMCEDAIDLAKNRVAEWLQHYMFIGEDKASSRARKAAEWLADAAIHKTHSRPVMLKQAEEIGLKVISLESDQRLQDHVLSVFHSTLLTFNVTNCTKIIENHNGKGFFMIFGVQRVSAPAKAIQR